MAVFLPTTEVVSFAFGELKMCFKLLQILSSMFLVDGMSCGGMSSSLHFSESLFYLAFSAF